MSLFRYIILLSHNNTMSCSFSVCSLITDVRESVTEIPRDSNEMKSLLMEHLGFGGKPNDADTNTTPYFLYKPR